LILDCGCILSWPNDVRKPCSPYHKSGFLITLSEAPLECPIAAFSGTEDYIANPEQMAPWCEQTSGTFRLHCFAGGHFFLHELQSQVIQMVVSELTPLVH